MPSSPTPLCPPPCLRRAVNGTKYCAEHQTTNRRIEHNRAYDRYRDNNDPIRKLYRTPRWQATRRIVLRRDILCRSCGHERATEVDHILSARLVVDNFGVAEFYNPDRLQGLCHPCHSSKTASEYGWTNRKGTRFDSLGNRGNTTVVCGLPGAGKSEYVKQHAAQDDHVFDYDVVMSEVTGLPIYETLPDAIGSVLAKRDQFIEATQYSTHHVWIIVSNPKAAVVDMLRVAGAEIVVLDTPPDICAERIRNRKNT